MVTLTNVIICCCTSSSWRINLPARGSMRSRGAAASQHCDPAADQRGVAARAGLGPVGVAPDHRPRHGHLRPVAGGNQRRARRRAHARRPPGHRRMGATAARRADAGEAQRHLLRARQRIRAVLAAHPPQADVLAVPADRTAGVRRRLPARAASPIPHRRRRRAGRLGLACAPEAASRPSRSSSPAIPRAATSPSTCCCSPMSPHPAAMVLFSPLIDLTFGLARAREALRRDPAIRVRDAKRLVGLYCTGTDLSHPRLTLDVAGGRRCRPR